MSRLLYVAFIPADDGETKPRCLGAFVDLHAAANVAFEAARKEWTADTPILCGEWVPPLDCEPTNDTYELLDTKLYCHAWIECVLLERREWTGERRKSVSTPTR